EVVAQEKEKTVVQKTQKLEILKSFNVTKETTDETINSEVKNFKDQFKADVVFSKIKRNAKGEIIAIKIDINCPNQETTSYQSLYYKTINPVIVFIARKKDNKEIVGFSVPNKYMNKNTRLYDSSGLYEVPPPPSPSKLPAPPPPIKSPKTTKVSDRDTYINDTKSAKEELAQLDDKTSIRSVLKQNLENKPVIVLNGSLNTSLKIEDIDADKIQSINVLKGHHATMKYGENGKNGIIEIITKEKIGKNEFQSLQGKTVQGFEYKKNKVVNEWKVESQPNTNTPKEINGWKIESEPIKKGIKQDIATTNKIDYNKIVIIVDGKISNSKKFKKLNPDEIVSIKVQKFSDDSQKIKDEAVQKYGKKALNGIIEVETKALFK
ncbi:MAG TPA: hypothetical protein VJ780_00025, partial [Flavobacterium sp.]|nr:hypothetical protein [Flavobacterium sp.]